MRIKIQAENEQEKEVLNGKQEVVFDNVSLFYLIVNRLLDGVPTTQDYFTQDTEWLVEKLYCSLKKIEKKL